MPRMIFVNLPVTDLRRSISDDTAAMLVFSETIHAAAFENA